MPSPGASPPNPSTLPSLLNQDPNNQGLNVTVGKSMLIATNPSGTPNTSVLLSNTQVSGEGKTTVGVPMGDGTIRNSDGFAPPDRVGQTVTYDINKTTSDQQTMSVSNASYKGQLPLNVAVTATVDGKTIQPDKFVNITGNVQLTYTFTNATAQPTPITYTGPTGEQVTDTEMLPVPFGGAFSTTLPQGFSNINAPWAEGGLGPTGTTLAGTLFLFPPLGKNTQSLSIQARADNASLPSATLNALPLALSDNSIGRLAFKYSPIASSAIDKLYQGGVTGQSMLLKYQMMLLKYSAIVAGINTQYIQPLISKIENGGPTVAAATQQLQELADGSAGLAQLMPQATTVINLVNTAVQKGNTAYRENITDPNSTLNKILNSLDQASATLDSVSGKLNPGKINDVLAKGVGSANALAKTAVNLCPQINTMSGDYFNSYQGQVDRAAGLLQVAGEPASATQLIAFNRFIGNLLTGQEKNIATCMDLAPTVYLWTQQLSTLLPQLETDINNAVAAVKKAANTVNQGVTYADLFKSLEPQIARILDHNCKYNPVTGAGIDACGLTQKSAFLDAKMKFATEQVVTKMAPGTAKAAEMIPLINKYFALAQKYAPAAGAAANAAPGELAAYGAKLGVYAGLAGTAVGAIDKGGTLLAKTTAELAAMDARAQAGQGIAAGPAQGANTNLGAYMYSMSGASDAAKQNGIRIGLAALLFVIGVATASALHARSKR